MNLLECKNQENVEVVKINAKDALKQRLLSFGIIKGAKVNFVGYSPAKSTVEIKVGVINIALRKEEAQHIEVKRI
jgi:ferrous iron transport protein A